MSGNTTPNMFPYQASSQASSPTPSAIKSKRDNYSQLLDHHNIEFPESINFSTNQILFSD